MALTLPYPGMVFVPLDILTAEEQNQIVANYTYIAEQFPIQSSMIDFTTFAKPVFKMVSSGQSITITPEVDGTIIIFAQKPATWGYAGGDLTLKTKITPASEIIRENYFTDKIVGGDTVGRTLNSIHMANIKAGIEYTIAPEVTGSAGGGLGIVTAYLFLPTN